MALAWTIWGCLIFTFVAIMVLGMVFEKDWLIYIGITGVILELAAVFILMIINAYINGEV